jgi:hypothetical protein
MKVSRIRCFWAYSVLVIILTTIPYLVGFSSQGSDLVFTGFVFGVEDGNSYIAKMLLGASGDWLFRTPYSAEPQRGVLAFLPYLLLGKLAAGDELHLQLVLLFHLFRAAVIPLGIWATYTFVDEFLQDDKWSSWATVLATFGSGLGWLLFLFTGGTLSGSMPLGFISPETFGFLAYFGLPHLVLARALLLLGLRWYLESPGSSHSAWKAGGAFAALGFVQPLTMVPGYAVLGIHQLLFLVQSRFRNLKTWRSRWLPSFSRILPLSLPVFLYFLISFSTDPFLKQWTDQNLILSPHPVHYLLAYGLLLPFGIFGIVKGWNTRKPAWLLPIGWILIIPLLAYAPYNLQRRLPEGSWVALVCLSAYGLSNLGIDKRIKDIIRVAIVALSLITPVLLLVGGSQVASSEAFPAFREREEVEAFEWLRDSVEKDSIVLTSYETGNALPAWAPLHVVIGHGPESANLEELLPLVDAFFNGEMVQDEAERFLSSQGVDYVFFDPLGSNVDGIEELPGTGLRIIFDQGAYAVYEVIGK